jgi:hypothetical protein
MFFYNEPEGPITPIPSYLVSPSAGSINEGATLTTTISTTNVATGTTLYWSLTGSGITAGDFSSGSLSGSDQTDGSSQFTFAHTLSSDLTTEGTETLIIELFTDSIRTVQVASASVTILDTSTTPVGGTDPFFSNVSLLLKMDSDFSDSSINNYTVTVNGDTTISSTESKYGGASGYFDGNGDYLTVPTDTELQFGTGDFTIEFWHYLLSKVTNFPCLYSNYNSFTTDSLSIFAGHDTGGSAFYQVAMSGVFPAIVSSTSIAYNTWVHVALVRQSGNVNLYINGQQAGSTTNNSNINGVGGVTYIATTGDTIASSYINGYLDDFRITKGVARYTANFTPPDSLPIS